MTETLTVHTARMQLDVHLQAHALQEGYPLFRSDNSKCGNDFPLVGSGTFGDVYSLGRSHVLKLYKGASLDVLEQAKRELKMYSYRHRCIIGCLGVISFVDAPSGILLQRGGEELFNVLLRLSGTLHDLQFQLYKLYLYDMFDALAFLQAHDISHFDLKLENLLVTPDRLQIADFGFAHSSKWELLKCTYPCGSPGYLPHSTVANDPQFAPCRDAWASACIVFPLTYGGMMYESLSSNAYKCLTKKLQARDVDMPFAKLYSGLTPRACGEELMTYLMFETNPSFSCLCVKLRPDHKRNVVS